MSNIHFLGIVRIMDPKTKWGGSFFIIKYSQESDSHLDFNSDIAVPKEFCLSVTRSGKGFCLMKIHWKSHSYCWEGNSILQEWMHGLIRVYPIYWSLGLYHINGPNQETTVHRGGSDPHSSYRHAPCPRHGVPRIIPAEEPAAAPLGTDASTTRPAVALSDSEAACSHVNVLLFGSRGDG